ncbi:conserved hypothetical protein [Flavobacterium sp. 9AF]|nr:conserved hypothetical protein [Flavobacterium sp. 9AF]
MTSLYIGLKGTRTLKKPKAWWDNPNAFEEKQLYINLRYQPQEENPDDNYEFEFHKKKSIPKNDERNYWFKVGKILDLESIFEYATDNSLSKNEAQILEKLKNAFCTNSLISYFEETEKNLDKVLKIFIRVNSGGTQLSYSDLLMSILTANFSSDIRDLMNKFVDSVRDQGFGVMGRDQVLKTCLLLTESNHIFQLKNFSKSNINKIEDNWEKITEAVFKAIKLLQEFGYTNRLSSAYILSILAYYIFINENYTQDNKEQMLNFVRNTQITSYFTTSLDGKLEVAAKTLRDSDNFKDFNEKLSNSKVQPLKISGDDIERMLDFQYGNPAVLPILQILYPNLDFKNSTFHIDHIYPKSKFNAINLSLPIEYHGKANFLYNLQLLEGDENLAKKAKDPEIWLDEHYQEDTDKIKAYKERNYIETNFELNWKEIDEFERLRSEKLKLQLETIFGLKKQNTST